MKKKFQLFLVFFLTYAFICCPVFIGSSFAEGNTNDSSSKTSWQNRIDSIKATVAFIQDNFSDWIKEFNIPPTSAEEMQANKDTRKDITQQIREKLGFKGLITRAK